MHTGGDPDRRETMSDPPHLTLPVYRMWTLSRMTPLLQNSCENYNTDRTLSSAKPVFWTSVTLNKLLSVGNLAPDIEGTNKPVVC